MKFHVNFWGSHPDKENDDCFSGDDFSTLEQAMAAFKAGSDDYCVAYIEIDGPEIYRVKANPNHDAKRRARQSANDDNDCQRENAMQVGMAFGCDGYNDAMGYDLETEHDRDRDDE